MSFAEFKLFFSMVPAVSLTSLAKKWAESTAIDCGTDLAPPITSPGVPWYYGVFGGVGGIVSRTLTAPLEKVKIVAQTSASPVSVFAELRRTLKTGGVRGLFAGNAANCLRVFPMASIVTYTYLNGLTYTPADNELDPMEPVYRGSVAAFAGCMGQACTYPIDVVRARLTVSAAGAGASSSGAGAGVLGTAKDILRESGVKGLYRGLVPTLLAVGPFLACQMATADALKSVAFEKGVEVSTPLMLCIAGSAGIAAQTVVYPLDVLRRRMQLNSAPPTSAAAAAASETVLADKTWTALQQVVRREGFRSLFAGIVPTYAKVLPSVAIAMTTTKTLIGASKDWDN